MNLDNLSTTAIASAGVAVLVILLVITYLIVKRVHRSRTTRTAHLNQPFSSSTSPSRSPHYPGHHESSRRASFATWGFGVPAGLPSHPNVAPSPSTGRTQLITPNSADSQTKPQRGIFGREVEIRKASLSSGSTRSNGHGGRGKVETRSPNNFRPESEELIVVTYEEGLAKLGFDRPLRNLSVDEPPPFEVARQAYPVASPRMVPGRSNPQRMSGNLAQGMSALREVDTEAVGGRHSVQDRDTTVNLGRGGSPDLEERNDRIREWVRTPQRALGSAPTNATSSSRPPFSRMASDDREYGSRTVRRVASDRDRGNLQSTWLPSYYHMADQRTRDVGMGSDMDSESSPKMVVSRGGRA